MEAFAVTTQGDPYQKAIGYACGSCSQVFRPLGRKPEFLRLAREAADRCCKPKCCADCGVQIRPTQDFCDRHLELRPLFRAQYVSPWQYDGAVFSRELVEVHGGVFSHVGELIDYCDLNAEPLPPYVFACRERHWPGLEVAIALRDSLTDHYAGAGHDVVDLGDLVTFVESWNARQTIVSWSPDFSRVLLMEDILAAVGAGCEEVAGCCC